MIWGSRPNLCVANALEVGGVPQDFNGGKVIRVPREENKSEIKA